MDKLRQIGSTQTQIFNEIKNIIFGECGKHPGNNMVNCSRCQIENYKNSIEIDKLNNVMEKLNGFNNGRDTTEGVGGNDFWIDASIKIDIPNSADKGCIIYVDNEGREISRDYLKPKPENPI